MNESTSFLVTLPRNALHFCEVGVMPDGSLVFHPGVVLTSFDGETTGFLCQYSISERIPRLFANNVLVEPLFEDPSPDAFTRRVIQLSRPKCNPVMLVFRGCTWGVVVTGIAERYKAIPLSPEEQEAFSKAAIELRFDGDQYAVSPRAMLQKRRFRGDDGDDLWTVFSRVQENVIRGGVSTRNRRGQLRKSRPVRSIDASTSLNRSLWVLADEMARLKAG